MKPEKMLGKLVSELKLHPRGGIASKSRLNEKEKEPHEFHKRTFLFFYENLAFKTSSFGLEEPSVPKGGKVTERNKIKSVPWTSQRFLQMI